MTQFLADAGVIPTQAPTLQFTQWVDKALPTPGENGVPDLLKSPAACATYFGGLREMTIANAELRPMVRVFDSNLDDYWELDGELSASIEDLMEDTGKVTIDVPYQPWIFDLLINNTQLIEDINLAIDYDPLNPNWRRRWGGKITEIHIKKDERGIHTITLTALHFREHAKRLLVAANPLFPPEVQLPRMWVLPGPARTICAITSFINLARLFMPGLSTVTNVLNPAGWINPISTSEPTQILPTEWPIQVAFVNTALDQSRWTSIGGAWQTWHETYKDVLADAGTMMRCYMYLTTDEDSPNTELADLMGAGGLDLVGQLLGIDVSQISQTVSQMSAPQRNCCVFSFEQVDGVTGPTGTVADGFLSTAAVTLDDLITPITIDLNTGDTYDPGAVLNGESVQDASGVGNTELLQALIDVAPEPPDVIWWDGEFNGFINTDLTYHKGGVKTIMTGSKSPTIVNQAQTFAIRYALSELSAVISDQIGQTYQTPGSPGLDNLYQDQLSNTLLAWERFTDPIRALHGGDVAWQEHFERGTGTAYTLASVLTLRSGDWKTRAFAAFKAEVENGYPWIADLDFTIGDRVGFEQDGVIYVDNVYGIKREWGWDRVLTVRATIGEDREKEDPFNAAFKTMANMWSLVGELAGQGTLFG